MQVLSRVEESSALLRVLRGRVAAMAAGAAALTLIGCASHPVGPDYQLPAQALVRAPAAQAAFLATSGNAADADGDAIFVATDLPTHWWHLYEDPQLDALIEQALAQNTDLRVAAANLERVQASETEAEDADRPKLAVSGGPSYGHISGLQELAPGYEPPSRLNYSAGVSLSYQLDVVGQIRRGIEAASADSAAAQAAYDLVRVNIAASTARAYAGVCSAGLALRSAAHSIELQQQAVQVAAKLQQAGRVGSNDVARAQGQLEQLQAVLPALQAQRHSGLFRLATLLGLPPQQFPAQVADCAQPPRVASALPVGDGAALLRRRPDVRQAERELASATARIGVATGELYPKVTLGLSAASAGPSNDFAGKDTFAWSLGPLISWTIPNTGAVRARIAQSEAQSRASLARFDGTVLTALRETETALDAYAQELQRHAALERARAAAATVAEQARRLYTGGKSGYLEALDAERSLAASDAALASSDGQLADQQIALFLALGGGWERAGVAGAGASAAGLSVAAPSAPRG
ncbi:MAG: TolC family protein [Steroidobacteraceae bacterium]